MGNSRKKKVGIVQKSKNEAQAYRIAVTRSLYSPEPTNQSSNNALRGSNEMSPNDHVKENQLKSVPTPKRVIFWEWLKTNLWELVFGVVLISVLGWLCVSVIELKVQVVELSVRLEYTRQGIEKLEDNSASKETLDLEMRNIEKALESANILSIHSLESRIQVLEGQLSSINDSG